MGPSQDAAHRWGRQLTVEVLRLLHERGLHNNGLDQPNGRFCFSDPLKQKLLEVLQEIAWDEACASF
jgi:hypothetical protein